MLYAKYRLEAPPFESIFDRSKEVRSLFMSHWDAVMHQYEQAAICSTRHSVASRLSRCLLDFDDRAVDSEFPFTHQQMANLIAADRATVSVTAGSFRRSGLIATDRGRVRILDRRGLRAMSCDCYARVRRQYEALFA
jgi:CRP-like cAMP-binding protein